MKAQLGMVVVVVLLCLCSGCVAIPPLITVNHQDKSPGDAGLRSRVDDLERRVHELEQKQDHR